MTLARTLAAAFAAGTLLSPAAAHARPVCENAEPCPTGDRVAATGTFNGGGAATLEIRARPDENARVTRTVATGRRALIVCQVRGGQASGPYGTSRIWDKLLHGGFVSDTRVFTGSDGRVAPDCAPGAPAPVPTYGGDPFAYDDPGAWAGGANCSGGYTKGAIALSRWIERHFRRASKTIGGYACRQNTAEPSQMSLHAEGRALDWMISAGSAANRRTVARFVGRLSAGGWTLGRAMGVQELIWNGRIWTASRHTEGWRAYTGPNPHTDHIHIGMNRVGASKRTSFWR